MSLRPACESHSSNQGENCPECHALNYPRICGQALYENGLRMATCCQPHGFEHSHDDHTATEAVRLGIARPHC